MRVTGGAGPTAEGLGWNVYDVDASAAADGTGAHGTASLYAAGRDGIRETRFDGSVTCLNITGATATLGVVADGHVVTVEVVDTGGGGRDRVNLVMDRRSRDDRSPLDGSEELWSLDTLVTGRAVVTPAGA